MTNNTFRAAALAAVSILMGGGILKADTAFAVDSKALLISFDTFAPGFVQSVRLIKGMQPGEGMLAIDFRPATKTLYGLGSTSRVYRIDTETGMATAVSTQSFTPALDGTEFGFDFNPTVDRIRVTSDNGQNLRLHPDTGMVVAIDGALKYEDGATATGIVASAYTNSFAGATTTVLYNLDANRKALVAQNPPNDGRLNVVGARVGLDLSSVAGFDISPNDGAAYAVIRLAGRNSSMFYRVFLETGDYTPLGEMAIFEQTGGLAIQPK